MLPENKTETEVGGSEIREDVIRERVDNALLRESEMIIIMGEEYEKLTALTERVEKLEKLAKGE